MNITDFEMMCREGKFHHINRTFEYLGSTLREYGAEFRTKLRQLDQVGIYVDDMLCDLDGEYYLFYLINVKRTLNKTNTKTFNMILNELKAEAAFAHDYPFGELYCGELHVIVFHVPEKYKRAYDVFNVFRSDKPVKYSQMYTKEERRFLFDRQYDKKTDHKVLKVLTKSSAYRKVFEEKINKYSIYANENQNVELIKLGVEEELEYLPMPKEEILNFKA